MPSVGDTGATFAFAAERWTSRSGASPLTVALLVLFCHPAHVAIANAKVRPFTQTRLCLDYEV